MNRFAVALLVACGTGVGDAKDAGPSAVDAPVGNADSDSSVDAGLNGCADFDDRSAPSADRAIAWVSDLSPRCILVSTGQTVTWQGPLGYHPFEPFGGDTPTPMVSTESGSSVSFTFPNAGDYGFRCRTHTAMKGAVRVKQ